MTVLTRGARPRRSGRRPGWLLLTVLLVLAIMASSALVFTSRVELLKLAVILALWAAVVAAFVSVIYRRQSDIDQAKARDLKLVYDLQLDREISARREYELTVESELRRELSTEIRAQAADEVAALRAELAALRANLEYLFDADLSHRPAIETEHEPVRPGRVSSSRIDADEDPNLRTEENPIIDVPAEPHAPEHEWSPTPLFGGAHRRPSEAEPTAGGASAVGGRAAGSRAPCGRGTRGRRAARRRRAAGRRAARGQPSSGRPSGWLRRAACRRGAGPRPNVPLAEQRAAEERLPQERALAEQRGGRGACRRGASRSGRGDRLAARTGRGAVDPGRNAGQQLVLSGRGERIRRGTTSAGDARRARDVHATRRFARTGVTPCPPTRPIRDVRHRPHRQRRPRSLRHLPRRRAPAEVPAPRHRSADEADSGDATGGHSVAELLARLEVGSTGGGRRRRREE